MSDSSSQPGAGRRTSAKLGSTIRAWLIVLIVLYGAFKVIDQVKYWLSTEVVVEVLSEPEGAKIEVDNEFIGRTPCSISIREGWDGKCAKSYRIRALPSRDGHWTQTKRLGALDSVPKRLFFQMNLVPAERVNDES